MKPVRLGQMAVPPPVAVPQPPEDPTTLNPLTYTLAARASVYRCFDANWGARGFHAGDEVRRGRFHPFVDADSKSVEVLYGANDEDGALSESVFRNVPVRGDRRIPRANLVHRLLVELVAGRDLTLIDLTSDGLRRLGISRAELTESDGRTYAETAEWAKCLHAHPGRFDGLRWVSRQHDTSQAFVLFGDRVAVSDLTLAPGAVPLTLGGGAGLDLVCTVANRAGITITGLTS